MSTRPTPLESVPAEAEPPRHRAIAERHGVDLADSSRPAGRGFDGRWPVRTHEAFVLLSALIAVIAAGTAIGLALTDWGAPNAITRFDVRAAEWFEDGRTDAMSTFSRIAAFPADSIPKIAVSALVCGWFLWRWRRWDEAVYVALPLVFEATCFITITHLVQRPRPEVEHVIHSTIDSSFPSGHVAAATVYVAIVAVVFRHTSALWARGLAVTVYVAIVAGVSWARAYQGVHHVSDIAAGIVLGIVSVLVADRVLRRGSSHGTAGTTDGRIGSRHFAHAAGAGDTPRPSELDDLSECPGS